MGGISAKYRTPVLRVLLQLPTGAGKTFCQAAFKFGPISAYNFDPFGRRVLTVALVTSELAGIAETRRARVV